MRILPIFAFLVLSLTALSAQEPKLYQASNSPTKRVKKSPEPPMKAGSTAAASNAKSLQDIEKQSMRTAGTKPAKKTTAAAAPKPERDKPNPPMNFGSGNNGAKTVGMTNQGTNPYKGRLRQKRSGVSH